jgi:hypothetical protein
MKYLLITTMLLGIGCHKDNPVTTETKQNSVINSPDTNTIFINNFQDIYLQFDTTYPGWRGCTSCISTATFIGADSFSFNYWQNQDSVIVYAFNNGWKKLIQYESIGRYTGEWYIDVYPNDTLTYEFENGIYPQRNFLQLYYQTHHYNSLKYNPNIMYFKIFTKPYNSNL